MFPVGILGLLMAGLLAAFMSNFAATVNAAPAYLVNDIYKRYINPNAPAKRYVWLSYIASFSVVVVGLLFGLFTHSIDSIVQWIVSGLWGGYTASNVLKWYWWRFNGWGYFWGMVTGHRQFVGCRCCSRSFMPSIRSRSSWGFRWSAACWARS